MHNIRLIKKCYLTRSTTCSADERVQAWKAVKTTGSLIGGIILLLVAIKVGLYKYRQDEAKSNMPPQPPVSREPGPEGLQEAAVKKTEKEERESRIKKIVEDNSEWRALGASKGNVYVESIELHVLDEKDREQAQNIINQINQMYPTMKKIWVSPKKWQYRGAQDKGVRPIIVKAQP